MTVLLAVSAGFSAFYRLIWLHSVEVLPGSSARFSLRGRQVHVRDGRES